MMKKTAVQTALALLSLAALVLLARVAGAPLAAMVGAFVAVHTAVAARPSSRPRLR